MIAHRHMKQGLIGLVMMVAFASVAIAQPATQPARPNFGGGLGAAGGGRGGQFFDRFHDVVYELDLTADQKTKIDAAFEKAKDDIQQMLPQTQGLSPQERQEKVRDVVQNLREQVRGVLTKEQAATLREKMEAMRAAAGGQAGAQGGALGGGRLGNAAGSAANAGAAQPQNNATPPAKPAIGAGANGAGRLDAIVQRLQDSIATLNLSGDQKSQVQTIVDDGKKAARGHARKSGVRPDATGGSSRSGPADSGGDAGSARRCADERSAGTTPRCDRNACAKCEQL